MHYVIKKWHQQIWGPDCMLKSSLNICFSSNKSTDEVFPNLRRSRGRDFCTVYFFTALQKGKEVYGTSKGNFHVTSLTFCESPSNSLLIRIKTLVSWALLYLTLRQKVFAEFSYSKSTGKPLPPKQEGYCLLYVICTVNRLASILGKFGKIPHQKYSRPHYWKLRPKTNS